MENLVNLKKLDCPRLPDYKGRTWKSNQESRRNILLENQKKRREDSYDAFRPFHDVFNVNDHDDDQEYTNMDVCDSNMDEEKLGKPAFPRLKDLFMFSEWMTELPIDFTDKWVFMPCPVGKRCLVRSTKGSTVVYSTRGFRTARFHSLLPSGGYVDECGSKYSKSNVTVLDCIWNGEVQKYFVLDILYWKSQSYLDTDIAFRSFWIKSKLEELPRLLEKSNKNPYPFVPLNYYACDIVTVSSVMSKYPYFEFDEPKIDGILFYHNEGCYTPGTSPLVLWLKPYMIPEIMGQDICVSEEYFKTRPTPYTNMFDFIGKYEALRSQKVKKGRNRRANRDIEEMDVTPSYCTEENVDIETD